MKNKINILTTDKVFFPDIDSENISMVNSLNKYGFKTHLMSWHDLYELLKNDENVDGDFVIRTVWDYPEYFEKFIEFLNVLKIKKIVTINPIDIIEWNIKKTYLLELLDAGIPVVPCEFFEAGSVIPKRKVKSVVKPVIGLGSCGAQLLNVGESIVVDVDSIVNPFRESIYNGEISVIMISGNPVLFVKKVPSQSDWRVQPQYGGKYNFIEEVPDSIIATCRKLYNYIYNKFQSKYLLFMRIDLVRDDCSMEWEVLEFEAIDPSLYGSISSKAIDALSDSLGVLYKD